MLEPGRVAKWFLYVGVFNALLSIGFLAPFLIPGPGGASDLFVLAFAVANFPGTWMLFAYFMFLVVGVLGMVLWAAVYYLASALMGKTSTSKMLSLAHIGFTQAGVYGATIAFFAAGFIGGRAMLPPESCSVLVEGCMGAGIAIVNTLITWTIIPTALSMVIAALGTLIGVFNVVFLTFQQKPGAIAELKYNFELESWLRSAIVLVFWLLVFLPFLIFPILFLTLPRAFEAAGITIGTPGALQAVNLFLVALIDPVKGAPVIPLIMAEVALPLGLPPVVGTLVLIFVFYWENETNKITLSKYAPLRAFKEVVVGSNEGAGILMVIPGIRQIKVGAVLGPVFEALERLKHRIAGKASPLPQTRR